MVYTGCLSIKDAYDAIDWFVIFLLAGVIPLGIAMENTGAVIFGEFVQRTKAELADEPNDYIVPAITYGNNFSNGSAAGFEIGVMIFTPPFLKKKFIKENSVN